MKVENELSIPDREAGYLALVQRISDITKEGRSKVAMAVNKQLVETHWTKKNYSEKTLEAQLIKHLEEFLLELGRGFAFMGRQYRMTIDNRDYFADLVFYHVVLKRYVIIELKIGAVRHEDIGQMNLYLGYFAIDKTNEGDNPPIGIVLGADKDDVMVQYATYDMDSNLFVAKYQLYLPNVAELRSLLFEQLEKNSKEVASDE
ncbi:MAG: DUF1016 domain-containing protein [Defluviitaleaceae bacterium]|nr:DUF1016 domain-containing protein [Defluviitaleaceae bacterium]